MAKHNKSSKKGVWIWIGIVVCVCVMLYAGFRIYTETKEDDLGNSTYLALKEQITKNEISGTAAGANSRNLEWEPDFSALKELSGDATAWIYSEGTPIDYPVVQGNDNTFYLTHLHDGTSNRVGAIFLDYRNASDFSDQNSILYGHHMKSGKMFAELENYKEQSYYDKHPFLTLYTQNGIYRIELMAGYVVDGSVNDLEMNFENEEKLNEFIQQAKGKSTFDCAVTVSGQDRIITMVTCTYDFTNARYALVGKMVKL